MKSGLFGLIASAMKATLVPLPVVSCWAVLAFGSSEAVLVSCSASGSRSGLLGSVGQIAVDGGVPSRAELVLAPSVALVRTGIATWLSGMTAATAGSAARSATWA